MPRRTPRSSHARAVRHTGTVRHARTVRHTRTVRRAGVVRRLGAVPLLLVLGLLTACSGAPATPSVGKSIQVFEQADRKVAPALTGNLLDGTGTYALADHRGELVVINFWASWCAPCVAEADDLETTYRATKDSKVSFLGINIRDDRDPARSFLVGRATYPSLFDPSSKLALDFAVAPTTIPTTIIVDRSGRIAAIARTAVQQDELEPVVRQLAAEAS